MTFGQIFLSLLYQAPQEIVVVFEKVQEPPDHSFIWFLGDIGSHSLPGVFLADSETKDEN